MANKHHFKKVYREEVLQSLQDKFQYGNVNQIPKLVKIVINRGLGESLVNSKVINTTVEQFHALTGQKPLLTKSRKSISNFKLRKGQVIGCKVTLRGDKMYEFLSKFINLGLPKVRDFRGLSVNGFDGQGNLNLGIKEDTLFPEIRDVDKTRGMDICIVTSAKSDAEAYELLLGFGMPFRDKVKSR
ncbi:MAG: 50S ribosomal protein L5 [Candidatus Margulisiibacteriota bacterium]|mgnify:CR=1 FL=1